MNPEIPSAQTGSSAGSKCEAEVADGGTSSRNRPLGGGQNPAHLYHLLFELLPSSVVLMNAQGFVLDANPAFCQQIGYGREELLGAHVSRFSHDSVEAIERNVARLMAGEVLEHLVTNVQKDGSLRHYELREAAITLPDGSRGILALSNDVTERLRAQQQKLEMERHLLHADKLKSLGVLAGGIAHEYNNVLTAITGNLELAMADWDAPPAIQGYLKNATAAAFRAAELTQQMLAYSGRGRFANRPVNLGALISGMAELLKASVSKKASLKLQVAEPLPFIEGDDAQLQQVVMNLVTNSSEALGDRPGNITITIRTREGSESYLAKSGLGDQLAPGSYVELEVRDTGCGMDEAVQKRLFDPFFSTKFTGRGLGMSVVLGVVRGHKGAIIVSSRPGKGTSVSVLFPASGVKPAAEARTLDAPPASNAAAPAQLAGTVLVADDEVPVRLMIAQVLQRMGLRVLTAADGEEAVALFQKHAHEITFVILDLTMPKLDGSKTLAEMRRHQPQVKAVLASGYDAETINQRYAHDGFAAFISKPFQIKTLARLARQFCGDAPSAGKEV